MIVKKANRDAIKYACRYFHYAKSCPIIKIGYNVYNDNNEWCGVILFGPGANKNLGNTYNLEPNDVVELVRVALNGKQEFTSKALSMCIREIKKDFPEIKLIVSYADTQQKHLGIIYQATNWIYTGVSIAKSFVIDGKKTHARSIKSKYGFTKKQTLLRDGHQVDIIKDKVKHKYLFPLHKSIKKQIISLSKPYPKSL